MEKQTDQPYEIVEEPATSNDKEYSYCIRILLLPPIAAVIIGFVSWIILMIQEFLEGGDEFGHVAEDAVYIMFWSLVLATLLLPAIYAILKLGGWWR